MKQICFAIASIVGLAALAEAGHFHSLSGNISEYKADASSISFHLTGNVYFAMRAEPVTDDTPTNMTEFMHFNFPVTSLPVRFTCWETNELIKVKFEHIRDQLGVFSREGQKLIAGIYEPTLSFSAGGELSELMGTFLQFLHVPPGMNIRTDSDHINGHLQKAAKGKSGILQPAP